MKIIIIILQAILNLARKRRDLIANRSKIPPDKKEYASKAVGGTALGLSIGALGLQLLGKMTDNLIVAATKEYPDLFGGVTIGNGKIKIGIPGIDKDIVLEAADIDHFKSCLK